MDLNPVILAIPMYFTLMAAELAYESFTRRKTYRLNDAVTNINTGVLQQLTNTFLTLFKIGLYIFIFEQWSFFTLPVNGWTFLLALVAWDLCYYWEHRMAHRVSLFWGGHVVHHQSEEYNLSVALRQTSTGFIWGLPFFLPMALIGIDPTQFVLAGGINLLYQFWIHTEHIGKMPRWFEAVFNTPSHHRVHHGRDPKYIDKNYAGILIIWDRLFGTFREEEERPTYGITKPLKSWNPVYANVAHYIDLFGWIRKSRSVGDAMQILFRPPGWLPEYMGGPMQVPEVDLDYQKYDAQNKTSVNWYVFVQFMFALLINAFYFFKNGAFDPWVKGGFAIWIIWTTLMFGFLFESDKKWLSWLEVLRVGIIPFAVYIILSSADFSSIVYAALLFFSIAYTLISIAWLLKIKSQAVSTVAASQAPMN